MFLLNYTQCIGGYENTSSFYDLALFKVAIVTMLQYEIVTHIEMFNIGVLSCFRSDR